MKEKQRFKFIKKFYKWGISSKSLKNTWWFVRQLFHTEYGKIISLMGFRFDSKSGLDITFLSFLELKAIGGVDLKCQENSH